MYEYTGTSYVHKWAKLALKIWGAYCRGVDRTSMGGGDLEKYNKNKDIKFFEKHKICT